jgi:arginase
VAVKIVRQPNKIALLGAPTSAAAMSAGHEAAPNALRAAGLIDRLKSIGYAITDLGDDPPQIYQLDEESPRARNVPRVLAALEALKPRVEQAVKSGALPLILSGDCSVVLATIAGLRRYFRHVSLLYMDRDADLQTPATTKSGCVDGMVISHVTGRGAAELVRFWGEPPLVREPDVALFGITRIDASEQDLLNRGPLRRYTAEEIHRVGAAESAQKAIDRISGKGYEFVLHFDVDVIENFQATNYSDAGGLSFDEVRGALEVFARQGHLAAIDVSAYNPAKDPDGRAAKQIVDLLSDILAKRLTALGSPAAEVSSESSEDASPADSAPAREDAVERELAPSGVPAGEPWSPDSLEETRESVEGGAPQATFPDSVDAPPRDTPEQADKSDSE